MKKYKLIKNTKTIILVTALTTTACASTLQAEDKRIEKEIVIEKTTENPKIQLQQNVAVEKVIVKKPIIPYSISDKSNPEFITNSFNKYIPNQELLGRLKELCEKSNFQISFYIATLDGNFQMGYKVNRQFEAASTLKFPYALYALDQIAKGNGSLDEIMLYLPQDKNGGTSDKIRKHGYNKKWTMEQIITHLITDSDNEAFKMLQRRYSKVGYNEWLQQIDPKLKTIQLHGTITFGKITAWELAKVYEHFINNYDKELYKWVGEKATNKPIGEHIKGALPNSKQITGKSGWRKEIGERHDAGIIDNSYILVTPSKLNLSKSGKYANNIDTFYNQEQIAMYNEIVSLIDQIVKDYEIYKQQIEESYKHSNDIVFRFKPELKEKIDILNQTLKIAILETKQFEKGNEEINKLLLKRLNNNKKKA